MSYRLSNEELARRLCHVPPNNGVLFRAVPVNGSGYCWQWERKA